VGVTLGESVGVTGAAFGVSDGEVVGVALGVETTTGVLVDVSEFADEEVDEPSVPSAKARLAGIGARIRRPAATKEITPFVKFLFKVIGPFYEDKKYSIFELYLMNRFFSAFYAKIVQNLK
jgi:hypothetical protein